ncbi:winged helix DNA-binding domain-containing protein [Kibdelosporangium philippinense]|uniref:Winged helix DNA-binding domain-containing protein n=1 Tax=Kibdelosporangium philippinense TaxID=211113 RepID=A0ABS8ZN44_9PSEU|nr:crosslink repair DNA glycosylase YcaQ family protein [Kibdelosporangium philippinense]MCE7007242.1 winged helix DNA-binding domain-containing protein [Kibdelosporangium philippinense]
MKLTRKALNRATLARQLLLDRSDMPISAAIEHLIGLQAQTTHSWYPGLRSRLIDFDPYALSGMLGNDEVLRLALMRSTIHLVTALPKEGLSLLKFHAPDAVHDIRFEAS